MNPHTVSRIGLYGGAFDPPHVGHLTLARCAIEQLSLDVLFVLPTGDAWHKDRVLTAANHRLAMATLNFADCGKAQVDDRELKRKGPTYTIDTLNEFKAAYPKSQFFLVMGADQAQRFDTWKQWQAIASQATLAVAHRPAAYGTAHDIEWHNVLNLKTVSLNMPLTTANATDIRSRLGRGFWPTDDLVPAVLQYIQHNQLYAEPHDPRH